MNYSIAPVNSGVDLHQPKYVPITQPRSNSMFQHYDKAPVAFKYQSQTKIPDSSPIKPKFNLSLAQLSQKKQKSNLVLKATNNSRYLETLNNLKKNPH